MEPCNEDNWKEWVTVRDIVDELIYTKKLLTDCADKHKALIVWNTELTDKNNK